MVLSGALVVVSVIPYLVSVIKRKTKPRIVSWIVWSILTTISSVAALSEGQYKTFILLMISSLATMTIAVFGWELGDKKISRLDVYCFIGALVGLVLWLALDSPALAVLVSIAANLIGSIPTVIHSWKAPKEETWLTFGLGSVGALFTVLIITEWRITAFAFPLYLFLINAALAVIIIGRRNLASKKSV